MPLRVAVLTSHRAPGLASVLRHTLHGSVFEIVGVVSSEDMFFDAAEVQRVGLPLVRRPLRAFHRACGRPLSDRLVREAYDEQLVSVLRSWRADLVFCCSYLYLLTAPVLQAFGGAVLNLHHSDLLDRADDGRVRYPGLRAVREAIFAGARETRSTVHVVTEAPDEGPAVLRSWPFAVSPLVEDMRREGAVDALKAYAFAHQEWMLRRSWGPLMSRALEIAALDRAGLSRGQLLGAPWELSERGRLTSAADVVLTPRKAAASVRC